MTDAPQEWKDTYTKLKEALDALPSQGEIPAETRAMFKAAFNTDNNNRAMYIFGRLDANKMIEIAKGGDVPWWPVAYGRAFFNDPEGLTKVYAALPEKDRADSATTSYKWLAEPYTLADGVTNSISAVVLKKLAALKADFNDDSGKWLEKSLRNYDEDSIRVLLDNGAAPATVYKVMDALLAAKNFAQAGKIQQALTKGTLYFKIDDETLMETKYIPGADGGASFKALFNFKSRRVNEIYEFGGTDKRTTMTSVSFDDYDPRAIGFAEEQLRKLGGKPADALGKPKLARLSA